MAYAPEQLARVPLGGLCELLAADGPVATLAGLRAALRAQAFRAKPLLRPLFADAPPFERFWAARLLPWLSSEPLQ